MTINDFKSLRETENKVEFKEAKHNFSFAGSRHTDIEERRKCVLGYIVAFANEGGGHLILGMSDYLPHETVGSDFALNSIGNLEDEIFSRLGIRVKIDEMFEDNKRVVCFNIPSRPIGKTLKFEGVPLMRVGGSLRNMSDEELFAILSEQEPDFSYKICEGGTLEDLDKVANRNLKEAYARKQDNINFISLNDCQALSDLGLIRENKITFAALILLGKEESIKKFIPQATIYLEYRNSLTQIVFDKRSIFNKAYFIFNNDLWESIDQRNGKFPVQQGMYIFDIPFFNKEVIREAINNAVAHRDYTQSGEIVIKQFPTALHICNPGGFPKGVNLENLLTVNSTPRNRLLADVMAKTGVVERSGQGIDKIFYQTISEAKPLPDYSHSNLYQVELQLSSVVEDKAFALFIKEVQNLREDGDKLSVQEVLALNIVRKDEDQRKIPLQLLNKLEKEGLLERVGKTKAQKRILSKSYYNFVDNKGIYSKLKLIQPDQIRILILNHLSNFSTAKMSDFESLLKNICNREQVKYQIEKMVENSMLEKSGTGKGTRYRKGKFIEEGENIINRAFELGIEEMKKRGELDEQKK